MIRDEEGKLRKHWKLIAAVFAIALGTIAIVLGGSVLLQGPTAEEPPNRAEWLSAISTFWGAVAGGIGAIGTAGALLIAAVSYRRQIADKHRAQAAAVTAGYRLEPFDSNTGSVRLRGARPVCYVRNDSTLPIYHVSLHTAVGSAEAATASTRVIPAGQEEKVYVKRGQSEVIAKFVDSAGVAWQRDGSGQLTEIEFVADEEPDELPASID